MKSKFTQLITLMSPENRQFRPVNQILGTQPRLGPIAANQIIPFSFMFIISWFARELLALSWVHTIFLAIGLCGCSWMLIGDRPWVFYSKFWAVPYLVRGRVNYDSILEGKVKQSLGKKKVKEGSHTFEMSAAEDFLHHQTMVRFSLRSRRVGAYLLKKKTGEFQLVFGFDCQGIHSFLSPSQIESIFNQLESGLKDIPPNEQMTFHLGAFKSDGERQRHLSKLVSQAPSTELEFLITGERARIQELARAGLREPKTLQIYVTYTPKTHHQATSDWIEKILLKVEKLWLNFKGEAHRYQEQKLRNLLYRGFTDGFLQWEQILNLKLGLNVTALDERQLWSRLWHRFNTTSPIPIPQLLILDKKGLQEKICSDVHGTTLLLADSVPFLDRQWVHAKNQYIGVLSFWDKPGGWSSKQEQLRYLWDVVARDLVTDTEIVCQITPANQALIKTSMQRLIKQSNLTAHRAIQHQSIDVAAQLNTKRSVEAQEKLISGGVAFHTGVAILVYRPTRERLDEACRYIENCFHRPAWVVREREIAWKLWLQTLPIVRETLLTMPLNNRRQLYLSEEVTGLIPLMKTRSGDREGIELIGEDGGTPIYIDLFTQHKNLAIFGTTRSGKSVLVSGILTQALARSIPVVALDYPKPDGSSTFSDYTHFMEAAYFDIGSSSVNLFERPDLRALPPEKQEERFLEYKDFLSNCLLAMVIGVSKDPLLSQTVRTVLYCALNQFFNDADLIRRYERAEAQGLGSRAWQDMPTLADFIEFCDFKRLAEQFKLYSLSERGLFPQAIEQIRLRLSYWLTSRVGKAISSPTSIPTEAPLIVFALRQLSQNEDAAILSLAAYAAALRRALEFPASIFFIDESPVLFRFPEIARLVGMLCANGAKSGIRVILTGQDPNTIHESVAGNQIFQNISTRLIGRIQAIATASFMEIFGYERSLISRNENFNAHKQGIYTQWLLDDNGIFTFCRFYPAYGLLGIVANNPDEQAIRAKFLARYGDKFEALAEFSKVLVKSLQSGIPLGQLLEREEMAILAGEQRRRF